MSSSLTVNMGEMARILGISLPTMRELPLKHPDLPVQQRGGSGVPWAFDPEAVQAFMKAKKDEEAAAEAARNEALAQLAFPGGDLLPPEERNQTAADRLKNATAMIKEDELRKQRGFLIQTTDMRQRLTSAWTMLAQALNAMPSNIGRRHNLPDAVVRDMRRYIQAQQRTLHGQLTDLLPPEDLEEAADDEDAEQAA